MGLQGYCRRGQGVSPTGNGMSRVPGSKMSMANAIARAGSQCLSHFPVRGSYRLGDSATLLWPFFVSEITSLLGRAEAALDKSDQL